MSAETEPGIGIKERRQTTPERAPYANMGHNENTLGGNAPTLRMVPACSATFPSWQEAWTLAQST
eukprot:1082794-Lingulodinium_polyedra.AAC.1